MARLDVFFKKMIELEASDLHLTTHVKPHFRLHGDMVPINGAPEWTSDEMRQVLYEIAPPENVEQFEKERDTDFAYELPGEARFRANLFVDRNGPGAVFRLIPDEILTADQLGLPEAVKNLCYLSKGLVLVTGPTGSGKSTTLAAMIDLINKTRADHIITIEDPIEFVHRQQKCLIHQREVGRHTQNFKRALRAALREDPDIVLVGELRDLETIEIAIETAETGHLVFGTLHTTTACSTVDRIIDQFPADRQGQIRTMLSSSLRGVIAQTLCKKQPKGRVAALEVLIATQAISALVREGKTHQLPSQMQMGGKSGMKLLNDSLVELVQMNQVLPEEAYLKSVNKEELVTKLNHIGVRVDMASLAEGVRSTSSGGPAAESAAAAPLKTAPPKAEPAPPPPLPSTPQAPAPQAPMAAPAKAPAPEPPPSAGGGLDDFEAFRQSRG